MLPHFGPRAGIPRGGKREAQRQRDLEPGAIPRRQHGGPRLGAGPNQVKCGWADTCSTGGATVAARQRALSVNLTIAQALGPNLSSFFPLNSRPRVCSLVPGDEVLMCAQIPGAPRLI